MPPMSLPPPFDYRSCCATTSVSFAVSLGSRFCLQLPPDRRRLLSTPRSLPPAMVSLGEHLFLSLLRLCIVGLLLQQLCCLCLASVPPQLLCLCAIHVACQIIIHFTFLLVSHLHHILVISPSGRLKPKPSPRVHGPSLPYTK